MPKRLSRLLRAPILLPSQLSANEKDTVGGQALIEGVMMRGKEKVSWAVRKPNSEIVVESFPFVSITKRVKVLGIPVVRGVINLFEALSLGFKALSRSADIAIEEDGQSVDKNGNARMTSDNNTVVVGAASCRPPVDNNDNTSSADNGTPSTDTPAPANGNAPPADKKTSLQDQAIFAFSMLIALGVSLGLFMYTPLWVATRIPIVNDSQILINLVAGTVRIVLFLAYLVLISLWGDIRRVFEYHGAEHKAILAYEDGKALTAENIEPYTTLHPRCGTSFLILVAICGILLFSVIDTLYVQHIGAFVNVFHRFVVHLVLIPLVAGVSYEALKLSDKFQHFPLVGLLIKPGLWLQKITTRKPDNSQIEIAVKALEAAV